MLTSSVASGELRAHPESASAASAAIAPAPAPIPVSSIRRGPASTLVATIVCVLVLVGAGAYFYLDSLESESTARNAALAAKLRAVVPPPAQATPFAVPGNDASTVAPPGGDMSAVDAALRAAELVSQPKPDSMGTYVPPTERVIAAAAKNKDKAASANGKTTRTAPRPVAAPTAAATPPAYASPAARVRPAPAAAGPCTPNVAALGLCSLPPASNQPKE